MVFEEICIIFSPVTLNNRQQFTICNNIQSKASAIVCGVPQGSTLGPPLFSLYINVLPLQTNFQVH